MKAKLTPIGKIMLFSLLIGLISVGKHLFINFNEIVNWFSSLGTAAFMFVPAVLIIFMIPTMVKNFPSDIPPFSSQNLKMAPIEKLGSNCNNCGANSWRNRNCEYCGSTFINQKK